MRISKGWSELSEELREAQRKRALSEICPIGTEVEIDLLASFLSLEPAGRPTAADALMRHPYFQGLQDRPPLTPPADEQQVCGGASGGLAWGASGVPQWPPGGKCHILPCRLHACRPLRRPQVDAAFAFEREKLNVNDLRILIANDLFRMQHPAGSDA